MEKKLKKAFPPSEGLRKNWKKMKLTLILCLLVLLGFGNSYSQVTNLSLNLKNADIRQVLQSIEEQTNYIFLYKDEIFDFSKKFSVDFENRNFDEILESICKQANVDYEVRNRQIVLKEKSLPVNTIQSIKSLTGKVVDSAGATLPGVSVVLKGTTQGTITDFEGNYALSNIPENATLVFSFVGMKTQEIAVAGKTSIDVVMEEDAIGIEEVVAVGYGTQKKANLTGAVSSVELRDAEGRAITTSSQLLQGKVAGVSIIQNSGRPGDDASTIRIRGISSIDNNNDPLIIIDGIEGSFNDVHPSDIESISVLKDAASASIYGSRASAGVIIIQTKSSKTSGIKLSYTGSVSAQWASALPKMVNSWEHAVLRNEAKKNMGLDPYYSAEQIELYKYGIEPSYPNTDWHDVYFSTSVMQNHYVTGSGGGENYKFSSSVGYTDQSGILIGTAAKKMTFRNNLDIDFLEKKLKVGMILSGYNQGIEELPSGTNSVLGYVASLSPTMWVSSIPDEYGNIMYSYPGRELAMYTGGGGIERKNSSLNTQYFIHVKPIKDLVGKFAYSNNIYKSDFVRFVPEVTSGSLEGDPAQTYESELEKSWSGTQRNTLQATIDYNKKIKNHKISALAGYERMERIYNYDKGKVKDLSTNEKIFDFGDPTSHYLNSNANEDATVSYFSRVNYSFKDKYLLEFNVRRDGSSRFSKENRWSTFPSVSAGWRLSEESFMKSFDFVSQFKLRASWGKLGNQNIGNYYAASDQMSGSEYYAFGHQIVSGRGTTVLANPNTKWETTEQINIGFDAKFINRIRLGFDYFYKTTYDILARVTIPPSLGVTVMPYQNMGDMLNKGVELTVGYNSPYKKSGLNISVDGNLSYLKNEITSLGVLNFVDHSGVLRSQVGGSFSGFYGYKCDGIYQISDFSWQENSNPDIGHDDRNYVLKDGLPDPSGIMFNPQPGDLKFRDIVSMPGETKPLITPDDKTIIGTSVPKWNYGLTINLSYKNFSLNVIGMGVKGVDSYQSGKMVQPFHNAGNGSVLREHADRRWTFDNQSTTYMRLVEDKARDALVSSYYLFDASFFRLKNVELSYTLSSALVKKIDIEKCRFFVSGENLLLITNYLSGFDPEKPSTVLSTGFHPQLVSYTFGVNLTF